MLVDFSKAFDSIAKVEQILLAYCFPKEIAIFIRMLYKDMKEMVHSPDGDSNFFDLVAENSQRNK